MDAGLEVFGATGSYQIDSKYKNPALLRKGAGATVEVSPGEVTISYLPIPLGPNEFLAWRSTIDSVFAQRDATNGYIYVRTAPGHTVEWWVFGYPTSLSTFGLQVFNADGERVFDSSEKPLRVIGSQSETVESYMFGSIASIQQKTYVRQVRSSGGVAPNIFLVNGLEFGVSKIVGSTVTIYKNQGFYSVATPTTSIPGDWAYNQTNGVTTQHLIIDVTDY